MLLQLYCSCIALVWTTYGNKTALDGGYVAI